MIWSNLFSDKATEKVLVNDGDMPMKINGIGIYFRCGLLKDIDIHDFPMQKHPNIPILLANISSPIHLIWFIPLRSCSNTSHKWTNSFHPIYTYLYRI